MSQLSEKSCLISLHDCKATTTVVMGGPAPARVALSRSTARGPGAKGSACACPPARPTAHARLLRWLAVPQSRPSESRSRLSDPCPPRPFRQDRGRADAWANTKGNYKGERHHEHRYPAFAPVGQPVVGLIRHEPLHRQCKNAAQRRSGRRFCSGSANAVAEGDALLTGLYPLVNI